MTELAADDAIAAIQARFPSVTGRDSLDHPAINVPMGEAEAMLQWLRDEQGYDFLVDVTAVDWESGAPARFTTFWHLYSTTRHTYLRVAADCADDANPTAPSVAGLWATANWHERETWDLMGVKFAHHPDLRRILMWEGYPHHPLRKEFPLAGKETDLPDLEVAAETGASAAPAPMAGGPFVASNQVEINLTAAEPRAKDESWNEKRPKPE